VLPYWASVERARVDCTAMTIGGKKLREGGMEVVGNEGGNNVLFAVGDNKKVVGANGIEVVLPSGTRQDAGLGTSRTGSVLFSLYVHGLGFQCVSFGLLV